MVSICALPLNKSVENHSFLGVSAVIPAVIILKSWLKMVVPEALPWWSRKRGDGAFRKFGDGGSENAAMVVPEMQQWWSLKYQYGVSILSNQSSVASPGASDSVALKSWACC